MKLKLPLVITMFYILGIIGLYVLSSVIEHGTCFTANPYWDYGFVRLPCYFIDSTYKILLNPTYIFMIIFSPTSFIPTTLFLSVTLLINSIFVYVLATVARTHHGKSST